MQIGSKVRITDLKSAFHGRFGTVKEIRRAPLEYGIRIDFYKNKEPVWFCIQELDEVK